MSVVDEVDSGAGVADLVAGHHDAVARPWRPTVCDPLLLELLDLTQVPAPAAELASWAPHGWRSLRDRLVLPAVEEGLLRVAIDADGCSWFQAALAAEDPFTHLTAVELKLRNWRRAIAQAGRYRLWAEQTYVALPASRVDGVVLHEAERNRVGVLAVHGDVDESWVVCALEAAAAPPVQPQRRRAAAERVLAGVRSPSRRVAGSPIL
ncbi:hypothetical protein [uncultured Pseudokineococcus sp.]|uniref:hypothetical protein n=1 Tax=uncultured Pseudokineococcus sp. TaxID=1642928 RepID=UPI00260D4628|nr:hypothetical protein [uncultured Pseudokineococcus sp.]